MRLHEQQDGDEHGPRQESDVKTPGGADIGKSPRGLDEQGIDRAGPKKPTGQPDSLFSYLIHSLAGLGRYRRIGSIVVLGSVAIFGIWNSLPDSVKEDALATTLGRGYRISPSYPRLEVLELRHIVDLSEWEPVVADAPLSGKVVWDRYFVCRKARDEASVLAELLGTSGVEPIVTSQTHSVEIRKLRLQFEGRPNLNLWETLLDISREPVDQPFRAHSRTTRYQAFRDEKAEWVSGSAQHPTDTMSIEVVFPQHKTGRNFRFSASPVIRQVNYRPVVPEAGRVVQEAANKIVWTIPDPQLNYAYRIDWEW